MRKLGLIAGIGLLLIAAFADRSSVSVSNLQAHVKYLSSPDLEGRYAIAPGSFKAADYIARVFQQSGLEPKGTDGYFQDWSPFNGSRPGPENHLKVKRGSVWEAPAEAIRPVTSTANAKAEGELVFVGYGISQPNAGYDDYQNVDVTGKIAVILRGAPRWEGVDAAIQRAARLQAKIATAAQKGAVGVILVNQPDNDNLMPLLFQRGSRGNASTVILNVQASVGDKLLQPLGLTVAEAVKRINEKGLPISASLNATAEIAASIETFPGTSRNVIGFIPGNDPQLRDEVIVIGAHYDHLGYGEVGSLAPEPGDIHPGADDNASGTAAIMELARLLAQNRDKLKRSVLVIAFSAEEEGLLGAVEFLRNPTVPRENIVAMLNFDMVGRMTGNRVSISGVGTAAEWESILKAANTENLNLQLSQSASGGSDHMPFMQRNIPVLFFFTGMHPDYHRPSDTWDKINYEGQAQIVALAERVVYDIASRPERMQFTRPQQPQQGGQRAQRSGFRVRIGLMPTYSEQEGVLLDGVAPGSPAEKAGLKQGDRIVAAMGQRVKNIEELTALYEKMEPGKPVEFTIIREGRELKIQVTPEAP
ncbi:MAG: M20/M25/M40 family metallo-hydrolase [Fimbriimonadales bacterium]|nr:M20/M25/M40 family metallo-hydrolase [Fimbriimonadales bacterium]